MVAGIILAIHVMAALYAFFRYRKDSLSDGLLAVGFFGLIFAVGWTIATMLVNLLLSIPFLSHLLQAPATSEFHRIVRKELNRDTISLVFLTAGEIVFYYYFLLRGGNRDLSLPEDNLKENLH